MKKKNHI